MEKKYLPENYPWSIKGLRDCIKENHLKSEIIFETKGYLPYLKIRNMAIVAVASYADSVILGANTKWCISEHISSWQQYVEKEKSVQLFIYDFQAKPGTNASMYGFTLKVNKGHVEPYCGFTRDDEPIAKFFKSKDDWSGLINKVIKPNFGSLEMFDKILEFHEKTYHVKEEMDEWEKIAFDTTMPPVNNIQIPANQIYLDDDDDFYIPSYSFPYWYETDY